MWESGPRASDARATLAALRPVAAACVTDLLDRVCSFTTTISPTRLRRVTSPPLNFRILFALLPSPPSAEVMPLLHSMHDASHTAIGKDERYWKAIGRLSLDWYSGGSMISWHHQVRCARCGWSQRLPAPVLAHTRKPFRR